MYCPKISEIPIPFKFKTGWPWSEDTPIPSSNQTSDSFWPRISIITPSYNQGQFIEETIRSVLLQGYPNLEYIVIDGGSSDNSIEIIKKYEKWLTYWVSEKDYGQSHAINKGWKRSTGEILAWLNSDDLFLPGVLQEVAKIWPHNKNIGFIHAQTEVININGFPTGIILGSPFELNTSLRSSENFVAQQSTFISRHAIEKVGFLDETLEMSMDWDLWVRIAAQYPVKFVPKVWSKIRIWGETKTSTIYKLSGQNHLTTVKKIIQNNGYGSISKSMRRLALAAAYGRIANLAYESGNFREFRKYFIQSLLVAPRLLGGPASPLLTFIISPKIIRLISVLKRRFINCFSKAKLN